MIPPVSDWRPTKILRHIETISTSCNPIVVETDAGIGYLKAINNAQGVDALVCELLGTALARWLELRTFDAAVINIGTTPELPLRPGMIAVPGPSFITREMVGAPWGGGRAYLGGLENPDDIARLVLFDTWLQNIDRFPPVESGFQPNYDNVFFTRSVAKAGHYVLIAIDHTHCFGGSALDLHLKDKAYIQDESVYGLFPEFRNRINMDAVAAGIAQMERLTRADVNELISSLPTEWSPAPSIKEALATFTIDRAQYLVSNFEATIESQMELDLHED